jgi:prepilin-type N-terminal cleavage/methylation domain-containing protein
MRPGNNVSRGYSLLELITVVAIIGIMGLVTIPAFMNYARSNSLKSAFMTVTTDIRNCRQRAISRNSQVRLELTSNNSYSFYEKTSSGTWGNLTHFSGSGAGNTKFLEKGLTFSANNLGDTDSNSKPDILFKADGTVNAGSGTPGPGSSPNCCTVTMLSPWKNISNNRYVVTLNTTGQISSAASHS